MTEMECVTRNLDDDGREPALLTFLVTASGASFLGIGSAFWGLVVGIVAWAVLVRRRRVVPA